MNDLFSDLTDNDPEKIKEMIGEDWYKFLPNGISHSLYEAANTVESLRQTTSILPVQEKMYRALRDTPPSSIKVVILGQDPYHNANAMGYAFGCAMSVSPSLDRILSTIKRQYPISSIQKTTTLEYLVKQGVLLLNTRFAVKEGTPLSLNEVDWDKISIPLVRSINKLDRPIIWMLWGKVAGIYERHLTNPKQIVLHPCEHPASAARKGVNWDCSHFSQANEQLINNNMTPIKWN